jgi:hypothetical protein
MEGWVATINEFSSAQDDASMNGGRMRTGGCLCGAVRYQVSGELSDAVACHCSQCARTTGHFLVSADCAVADFTFEKAETLRWYRSSEKAERGFCSSCGSNLIWRSLGGDMISVTAGTLDRPTGLRMKRHIFCASRSDYYEIDDGLPQNAAGSGAG